MEKKRVFWSILSVMMVVMLSIGLSSCSKDDDEGGSSSGSVGKFTYGSKSVRVDYGYYGREPGWITLRFYNLNPSVLSGIPSSFSYIDIDIRCPGNDGTEVPAGEYDYFSVVAGIGLTSKDDDGDEWTGEYWGGFGDIDWKHEDVGKQDTKLTIKKNGDVYSISFSDVAINNKVDGIIWGDDGYRTDIASFSYTGTLTLDEDL